MAGPSGGGGVGGGAKFGVEEEDSGLLKFGPGASRRSPRLERAILADSHCPLFGVQILAGRRR